MNGPFFITFDTTQEIPTPTPTGPCTCATFLKHKWAKTGVEVHVSTIRPIFKSAYPTATWECVHGKDLFIEPTSDQVAFWVENKVK